MTPSGSRPVHEAEVVVVGAGTAGSVVAAGLARRGVDVAVLESGPSAAPTPWWSLAGAFDPDTSEGIEVGLGGGRTVATRRGRGVGGSAAVNGCYWIRGTAADHAEWVEATGEAGWDHRRVDAAADALERDADVPTRRDGSIPVVRDAALEPVSEAAVAAAAARGIDWLEDLNGGPEVGIGPVPFNVGDGRRADPATALGLRDGPTSSFGGRLEVGARVERVVVEAGRVVGVDAVGPAGRHRWRAAHVVCCAGALGTAQLLWDSDIGPADELVGSGRPVVADLPVGVAAWDHPSIDLPYLPRPGLVLDTRTSFMQLALHLDDPTAGVVEVLPTRRPYGVVTGADPDDPELALRVTLMRPRSRVRLRPGPAATPGVHYGTLDTDGDLPALCAAVTVAAQLAATPEFSDVVADWRGPSPEVLADPSRLAGWVAERVGSAFHLGGTAPMGRPELAGTVVDARLQVLGVPGLWVADAAVLPAPLRRGPVATVAVLGAMVTETVAAAVE